MIILDVRNNELLFYNSTFFNTFNLKHFSRNENELIS